MFSFRLRCVCLSRRPLVAQPVFAAIWGSGANMDEPLPAVDALCGRQASRNLIVFGMMAFLPRSESDVETPSQKTTSFQATSFWADGHVP